jgi:hypothetical protein
LTNTCTHRILIGSNGNRKYSGFGGPQEDAITPSISMSEKEAFTSALFDSIRLGAVDNLSLLH